MWALPQRYEKATATLWKHDRYRYCSGSGSYYVTGAILVRYGCVSKILALR